MTRKLYIKTYGCQMNVYDSRRMADVLAPLGFRTIDNPDEADLVVLNTCHIREKAAEKVYSDIGRLRQIKERRNKGHMLLAVGGCVGQAEGAEIMRRAPAVDMVFGPQTYHRLPALLAEAERQIDQTGKARVLDTEFPEEAKFDALPSHLATGAPSAFLTVQEGCDKFCAFCVVPYTRGAEYSRPVADIEAEARELVDAGAVEIMLLGQNVNAFHGLDEAGNNIGLGDLIERLDGIGGLKRIRYTTSHPRDMQDDLIRAHAEVEACMPYIHLPVQSGSDRILEAMNRQHRASDYLAIIDRLRAARPDIAVSGDFIVGFPGETDSDFADTLSLVREVGYAQAYSFKYSPRPGTPASALDEQVPEPVKADRLQALQEELNKQQRAFNESSVGREMEILLERTGRDAGQRAGRSPYMQAVHVNLSAEGQQAQKLDGIAHDAYNSHMNGEIGGLVPVKIVSAGPNSLEGRLC